MEELLQRIAISPTSAWYLAPGKPAERVLDELRTMLWFETLWTRANVRTPYALGKVIQPDTYRTKPTDDDEDDGTVNHGKGPRKENDKSTPLVFFHHNLWAKYRKGEIVPGARVRELAELKFPGSQAIFDHPFFDAIDPRTPMLGRVDALIRRLHASTQRALIEAYSLRSGTFHRRKSLVTTLRMLERVATLDALAALVILAREAQERSDYAAADEVCHSLFLTLQIHCVSYPAMRLRGPYGHVLDAWVFRAASHGELRYCVEPRMLGMGSTLLWMVLLREEDDGVLNGGAVDWYRRAANYSRGTLGDDFRFALQVPRRIREGIETPSVEALTELRRDDRLRAWGYRTLSTPGASRQITAGTLIQIRRDAKADVVAKLQSQQRPDAGSFNEASR